MRNPRTEYPLKLPVRLADTGDAALRRGLFVACETTGLSFERDKAIEIALLPFTDAPADGRIAEVLHHEAQVHLHDPGHPLDGLITALTGLTDEGLQGQHVDVEPQAPSSRARTSSSPTTHASTARSSSAPCPRRALPWVCSMREVPWTAHGFPSTALHCLACSYDVFARRRHRALADCEVGVWLLAQRLPGSERRVLAAAREPARPETVRLWAVHAAFETKDALKARGYRWMPEHRGAIPRSWWTELAPEDVDAELAWLRETVYATAPTPPHPAAARARRGSLARRPRRHHHPGRARAGRCTLSRAPMAPLDGNRPKESEHGPRRRRCIAPWRSRSAHRPACLPRESRPPARRRQAIDRVPEPQRTRTPHDLEPLKEWLATTFEGAR